MAKLPRVTAKVFASNAPQDKIGQFGSAKAGTKVNTSDISTIQGLPAFTTGWTEAVVQGQNYPTIEEMNGLQKVFSQQIAYLFEQGIPEYDSNSTYFTGSVCKVATANSLTFYVSKVDNNLGNSVSNNIFWEAYAQNKTFVSSQLNLGLGTTDLTNYMPNDGLAYFLWIQAYINSKSGTAHTLNVTTDLFPSTVLVQTDGDDGRQSRSINIVPIPVGAGRTITLTATGGSTDCKLLGYCRI